MIKLSSLALRMKNLRPRVKKVDFLQLHSPQKMAGPSERTKLPKKRRRPQARA